jgi:hypothetical protein
MTDRELLEAAAKAAGATHVVPGRCCGIEGTLVAPVWGLLCDNSFYWNPLLDDGDALRLAVEMRFTISPCASGVFVSRDLDEPVITQHWEDGRLATTRRAIVRAAAAMAARGANDA